MPSSNHDSHTTTGPGLAPAEAARALHHSYALLSQLFLGGPRAALLPYLEAAPALAEQLPRPLDWDQAAAEHYALFGFSLHPYEGIFRDSSGLLGGATAEAVLRHYQEAGYTPEMSASSPDHVGYELGFLAYLCQGEGEAHVAGDERAAQRLRLLARRFMAEHLFRWLPALAIALTRQGRPFYAALGEWTLQVVSLHHEALAAEGDGGPVSVSPLPEAPDLLADNVGLKEISRHLTTPPYSGMYVGKEEVSRLGRRFELPRGFGERGQMLLNLLRTAAQYGLLPEVFGALEEMAGEWREAYARMARQEPALAPFVAQWAGQVTRTGTILAGLGEAVRRHGEAPAGRDSQA